MAERKSSKRGRPSRLNPDLFWFVVHRSYAIIRSRHADTWERIADAVGMSSATLQQARQRYLASVAPAHRATLQRLQKSVVWLVGPEWPEASEETVAKRLDQAVAAKMNLLESLALLTNPTLRRRHALSRFVSAQEMAVSWRNLQPRRFL